MSVRTRLLLSAAQFAIGFATIPALAQSPAQPAAPPGSIPPSGPGRFADRFEAANTTHDGRLTLAQAQAAHMTTVARDFSAIDAQNKGFVTMDDIRAFHRQRRAAGAAATPAPAGAPR